READERIASRRRLEIEDDPALAAVDGVERRAFGADRAGHAAGRIAAGRLDLDHIRAQIAQLHRAIRPGHHLGDVEDSDAVKGLVSHGVQPRRTQGPERKTKTYLSRLLYVPRPA